VINVELEERDYLSGLRGAKARDLRRAAERYLGRSDSLVVLVVGDPHQLAGALDSLGLGPVRLLKPVVSPR
jgi:hypothetical protein